MTTSEIEDRLNMTEAERRQALDDGCDYFDALKRGWIENGGLEEMEEAEYGHE